MKCSPKLKVSVMQAMKNGQTLDIIATTFSISKSTVSYIVSSQLDRERTDNWLYNQRMDELVAKGLNPPARY